jgi:hypothetical protein
MKCHAFYLLGSFPNPLKFLSLPTTLCKAILLKFFEKNSKNLFSLPTTEDRAEIPKKHNKNNVDIGFGIC